MKTLEEIKEILQNQKPYLAKKYGVTEIGVFGSYLILWSTARRTTLRYTGELTLSQLATAGDGSSWGVDGTSVPFTGVAASLNGFWRWGWWLSGWWLSGWWLSGRRLSCRWLSGWGWGWRGRSRRPTRPAKPPYPKQGQPNDDNQDHTQHTPEDHPIGAGLAGSFCHRGWRCQLRFSDIISDQAGLLVSIGLAFSSKDRPSLPRRGNNLNCGLQSLDHVTGRDVAVCRLLGQRLQNDSFNGVIDS
jgi:hypothetical protein